jgi:chemotaxis protein methyltransferase CheR
MNPLLDELSEECFLESLKLIHAVTGITIGQNRKSMVQGRLRKRATELQMASYEDYLEQVKKDPSEEVVFIDLVTTNETCFFRTPRIWNYIYDVFLPEWHAKNPGRKFFAWSAAASGGDEAHSLGVAFQAFKEQNPKFSYQILGTDISAEMIQTCQRGMYRGRSIEAFKRYKKPWFERYMIGQGEEEYQAVAEIRNRIRFQTHNLFKPLTCPEQFDLVLLRNVLIYFTAADQEKVLHLIEPKMTSSGVLIIGESESLTHIQTPYSGIQPLVYQKKSIGSEKKAA